MAQPKILFWDIETSYKIGAFFQMYKTNIQPKNVLLNTVMLCAAWSWDGKKKVESVSILDDEKSFKRNCYDVRKLHICDKIVTQKLHEVLSEADIVVAHNGDRFDLKYFTARAIYHGLPPITPPLTVDTYKEVNKIAQFDSHGLDALCSQLELSRKLKTEPGLWLSSTLGCKKNLKKMVRYCKKDIPPLKDLYYTIRPYMKTHPNMNLFAPEQGLLCPKCGSNNYIARGKVPYGQGIRRRYSCRACGTWFPGVKSVWTIGKKG